MSVLPEILILPPGRRGALQMTPSDISKKSAIAKVRVLVEQVIRRIKTFKILTTEMSISMLEKVDDIVLVCAAICNFKEPMWYNSYRLNIFFYMRVPISSQFSISISLLKISENQRLPNTFRWCENRTLTWNGLTNILIVLQSYFASK